MLLHSPFSSSGGKWHTMIKRCRNKDVVSCLIVVSLMNGPQRTACVTTGYGRMGRNEIIRIYITPLLLVVQ